MENKYILALDQGTTASKAIVFNHKGEIVHQSHREFEQIFPKSGWVEHDPIKIWDSQFGAAREVLSAAEIEASSVVGIGITNQRETTLVWDRETGIPVYNAIVWQDRRTAEFCDALKAKKHGEMIKDKTGLIVDSYFSATKLKWILDHVEGAREKAVAGNLAFGTIDTWLIWKLTGGKTHATDVTNASRTMLYNIHALEWDTDLLDLMDIPDSLLPEVRSSSEIYGLTQKNYFGEEIPIAGVAGDQQASAFGQMCLQLGNVKNTYGTGCFMLCNTGTRPVTSNNALLTTIAWQIDGQTHYALEGSIYMGGSIVQWLRDGLGIIKSSSEVEKLAASVEDTGGVYLVPAHTGLGAPYWDQHAKGTITGLTRGSTAAHIARAALEGIAFQTMDVLKAMEDDTGIPIKVLKVDGGAAVNNLLMQIQADIIGVPVIRSKILETTALGVAYLAGLAVNYWKGLHEIQNQWTMDRKFEKQINDDELQLRLLGWKKALYKTLEKN